MGYAQFIFLGIVCFSVFRLLRRRHRLSLRPQFWKSLKFPLCAQKSIEVNVPKLKKAQDGFYKKHPLGAFIEEEVRNIPQNSAPEISLPRNYEGQAFAYLRNCAHRIQKKFLSKYGKHSWKFLGRTLLDQRSFLDLFQNDRDSIVILYNVWEQHVIFVSGSVQNFLGVSPYDFREKFFSILHDCQAWHRAINEVKWKQMMYIPLALRLNKKERLQAWDGYIMRFKQGELELALCVLYPAYAVKMT